MKHTGLRIAIAASVLLAGCSSSDNAATTAPQTTASSSTTTTLDPASSFSPGPPAVAGIWLAELGSIILQFRLDAGPDDQISGVFDSPAEGVTDLPVTVTSNDGTVTISIPAAFAVFEGSVADDTMNGVWKQGGNELNLVFRRQAEAFAFSRPQEPAPPFPYTATDVLITNGDITLAGTLTVPEGSGPFPAAVLTSGSGAQDRNETLMGHKPFLVLADALARAGVATLRFDDRGVGESTGTPIGATTADLATDTLAAVEFLSDQDQIGAIGQIGHSEGGLIGPVVANQSDLVSFVVMLAGPGLPGAELLLTQVEDLLRAEGLPEDAIAWRLEWNAELIRLSASDQPAATIATQMRTLLADAAADAPFGMEAQVGEQAIEQMVAAFTDPWMRYFLAYDPRPELAQLDVPVLALIGDLDLQASSATNIPALDTVLSGNTDATVMELPGLNHLFQHATTGAVSEYGLIEETFSSEVLAMISDWINERF